VAGKPVSAALSTLRSKSRVPEFTAELLETGTTSTGE
jgi:hypothetical protein